MQLAPSLRSWCKDNGFFVLAQGYNRNPYKFYTKILIDRFITAVIS